MRKEISAPFDMSKFRVHLEDGPRLRPLKLTADFWKRLDPELSEGRIMGASFIEKPEELHPTTWEMHPEGDELLCLCSGAIDLVLDDPYGEHTIALNAGSAYVIDSGIWHRLLLREPGFLLVITRGKGTQLRDV